MLKLIYLGKGGKLDSIIEDQVGRCFKNELSDVEGKNDTLTCYPYIHTYDRFTYIFKLYVEMSFFEI